MPALRRPARLAVPVPLRRGRRDLPHRPVHQSAPAGQAAARADPGRPRSRPAVAARAPRRRRRSPTDTPRADIRIGYARCSHLTQELQSQLDALAAHGIPREKIFAEKISTRVRVRPKFEAALEACPADQGPRPALPGHLHRLRDEAPGPRRRRAHRPSRPPHRARPGPGDARRAAAPGSTTPPAPGRLLFAFFAAMAETERENIREATLEGLDAAARKGNHGGRPPVITDDMLHTVLRRRADGESVEDIRPT